MKKLLLFTIPLLGVLLLAGCTVNVKQDNPTPDISVGARTENSGFKKVDISNRSYSQLQGNITAVVPATDGGADLGTSTLYWGKIFAQEAIIASTTFGTVAVSSTVLGTTTMAGLIVSSLDAGSVVFAGASGAVMDDNTNFFWDDTNNFLGIGTSSPDVGVHIGAATPDSLTASANDIFVSGELEVDGNAWFDGTTTSITNLYAGTIELPQDGGLMDIMDMPVSSAAGDTTKQGYTLSVDGYAALSLWAKDSGNDGNASSTVMEIRAGKAEKTRAVTAATTFIVGDYHINADTTGAAFAIEIDSDFITQGTATLNSVGVISDTGGLAGTNNITITTEGAELINGQNTYVISGNHDSVHFKCNGVACFIF